MPDDTPSQSPPTHTPSTRTHSSRTAVETRDDDAFESRLAAVERALTGGETHLDGLQNAAELAARVDELESTAESIDDRLAEVEAAAQALRGYVGGVRAVNQSVERRADAALAAVESLEDALCDDAGVDGFPESDADPLGSDAPTGTDVDDAPQGETPADRLREP